MEPGPGAGWDPPECNRYFAQYLSQRATEPPAATRGYKKRCGGRWERSSSRVKLAGLEGLNSVQMAGRLCQP